MVAEFFDDGRKLSIGKIVAPILFAGNPLSTSNSCHSVEIEGRSTDQILEQKSPTTDNHKVK